MPCLIQFIVVCSSRYFMSKVVLTFEIHVTCLVIHIDVGSVRKQYVEKDQTYAMFLNNIFFLPTFCAYQSSEQKKLTSALPQGHKRINIHTHLKCNLCFQLVKRCLYITLRRRLGSITDSMQT